LVVFLGPSLPAAQARAIAPCAVLPPARQGDVWRALLRDPAPRALALIDGVFEAQPSVWHHELLDALEAGVRVFGASSMGALRAAELAPFGMRGVGTVVRWVRDGSADDADVALLHGDREHGHRALTVPHVTVRFAAQQARRARVLSRGEERALVRASARVFYQERTWGRALAALGPRARRRWEAWARRGLPDVKALDARACIALAARSLRVAPGAGLRDRPPPSSLVRNRRLRDAMPGALEALRVRADAGALRDAGLRRALLAGLLRELRLRPSPRDVARAEQGWLRSLGVPRRDRAAFLRASGLTAPEARRLCEDVALERLALDHALRLLSDGPSPDEALAAEARLRGHWAALARR
jgi:hypothetical protein